MCCVTQELPGVLPGFGYGGVTLCAGTFQSLRLPVRIPLAGSYNPGGKPPVWAVPLSLATTYGIDSLSFPPVTEMFHFTGYRAPPPMCSREGGGALPPPGYPIRKSPDQSACAAPRSLSQLVTSFIACRHQGIHCVPFSSLTFRSFRKSSFTTSPASGRLPPPRSPRHRGPQKRGRAPLAGGRKSNIKTNIRIRMDFP